MSYRMNWQIKGDEEKLHCCIAGFVQQMGILNDCHSLVQVHMSVHQKHFRN